MNQTGGSSCFTGDTAVGILLQDSIENSIGNLITDFVRMPFRYGFRCKKEMCHELTSKRIVKTSVIQHVEHKG